MALDMNNALCTPYSHKMIDKQIALYTQKDHSLIEKHMA